VRLAVPAKFELIGQQSDLSGNLRLRYGSDPSDPHVFVLTLTPKYVARSLKDGLPVTFFELEKYAYENAGDLRSKPSSGKNFVSAR
jgi:hypothetical protein